MLGLDVGGSCHGVAFRVAAHHAAAELRLLWRREMTAGSYCPRWVNVDAGNDTLRALAFIVNRKHPSYAGGCRSKRSSTDGERARPPRHPAEYLLETTRSLPEHGLRDSYLIELRKRVLAMHRACACPLSGRTVTGIDTQIDA